MKRDHYSLHSAALLLRGSLPLGALLLFFAPTIASAQTTPDASAAASTATVTTPQPTATQPTGQTTNPTNPTTANPAPAAPTATAAPAAVNPPATAAPAAANPTAIAAPGVVYLPVTNPQWSYPVATPYPVPYPTTYPTTVAAPGANPGGFTVQVTTQIGIPNQGAYPQGYPVMLPGQPGVAGQSVYPPSGVGSTGVPTPGGWITPGYPAGLYPTGTLATSTNPIAPNTLTDAIANPALLPLAAQSIWQQLSTTSSLNSQSIAPLQQFTRDYPNFVPAYIQLAQTLIANNRTADAITTLERGVTLYPSQPDLARSLIVVLGNANRWNEAAMIARQFVIRNPNSPLVSEFSRLADESSKLSQSPSSTVRPAANSMLGNVLSSGLGYLLTGRLTSPVTNSSSSIWSSSSPTIVSSDQTTQEFLQRVQLLNDAEVSNYINDIGRKLGASTGRNFDFYVVRDRDTGAIALPNGKIFVSAGSILNSTSETELATLIARQMGHSLLSHPDQVARRSNLTSNLIRLLPTVGGLVNPKVRQFNNSTAGTLVSGLMGSVSNGLLKPSYTTSMVTNANAKATQLLEAAGYNQGNLLNISTGGDRYSQMKTKVQQLLGTNSASWWSLGQ